MGMIVIRQTLYLTKDRTRLVEITDPAADTLFCGRGDAVSEDELRRLGWTRPDTKASLQAKALEAAPENKAVDMPRRAKRAR